MIKLSIIIPVYNVEKYIGKCLNSIVSAIEKINSNDTEIIMIDDGSTDSSKDIMDQYALKYPYMKAIHQQNMGVAVARNTGLALSNGEYVWFVDSDDEVTNDSMDIIVRSINTNDGVDIFLFDAIKINNEKEEKWSHFDLVWTIADSSLNTLLSAGTLYYPIVDRLKSVRFPKTDIPLAAPWDKVIRRHFLYENDIRFNEKLKVLDDMVFSMELFDNSQKTQYLKEEIYKYRYVSDSITHKYTPDRIDKDILVWNVLWDEYIKIFKLDERRYDEELKDLFKQAIYLRIIKSFSIACGLSIFNKKNSLTLKEKMWRAKLAVNLYCYKEAFNNVKLKYAEWRLKPVIIMVRLRCLFGVYVLSKLNELI